jgi:putative tricarboxylic transport membrane protein
MKKIVSSLLVLAMVLGLSPIVLAQFPEREVEWILWSSPGGGSDTTARTIGMPLRKALGQSLIIINKPGGSGARAMTHLQKAEADGYTWLFVTNTLITSIARDVVKYEIDDFVPVALLNHDAHLIAVPASSPAKDINDLITMGKEKSLKWGLTHFGGSDHVGAQVFSKSVGVKYQPVIFQGGGELNAAVLSGVLDTIITNTTQAMGQIEAGNIRVLATMAPERLSILPDVPTLKELGHDISMGTWRGVMVKKGTDPEIVKTIGDLILESSKKDVYQNFLRDRAMEYNVLGSKEFEKFVDSQTELLTNAIEEIGTK